MRRRLLDIILIRVQYYRVYLSPSRRPSHEIYRGRTCPEEHRAVPCLFAAKTVAIVGCAAFHAASHASFWGS